MDYERFLKIENKLSINPSQYTKPIRVYCDVDGVIQPFLKSKHDLDNFSKRDITYYREDYYNGGMRKKDGKIHYNRQIVENLVELSKHPLIDFVWLTAWKVSAPYALDRALGIKSLGFLDWQFKMTDYNHTFKKVAIIKDQKTSPSNFIWLEDLANSPYYDTPLFAEPVKDSNYQIIRYKTVIPEDRYLSINTDSYIGLQLEDMDNIKRWVERVALEK